MSNSAYHGTILIGDSCIGGIGILEKIRRWAGGYRILYIADYEKNPFGLRSTDDIAGIVRSWFYNLVGSGEEIRLVVIACNTASIASYDTLPILADEFNVPVVNLVDGVAKCVEDNTEHIKLKNVAIMGTEYTIKSGRYAEIVKQYRPNQVINIAGTRIEHCAMLDGCDSLNGKMILDGELQEYKDQSIDTLVLACTAFSLIPEYIRPFVGNGVVFLDPASYVSEMARQILKVANPSTCHNIHILSTRLSQKTLSIINRYASSILGNEVSVSHIRMVR